MAQKTANRLTKSDWIDAGFEAVIAQGPDALKAEPLARRLRTTKGSFYWHFADVPAYHEALLSAWEAQCNTALVTVLAEETAPAPRLRRLGQLIAEDPSGKPIDAAVRAWARGNTPAAEAIARQDAKRLAHIHEFLAALDIANPEMARIIYAAAIGMQSISTSRTGQNAEAIGSLVDLVLALR